MHNRFFSKKAIYFAKNLYICTEMSNFVLANRQNELIYKQQN